MKKIFLFLALMALTVTLLPGCAGLGGAQTSGTGFGGIEVRVTDAPPGYEILNVWVHFSEVSVHKAGDGSEESEDDGEWIDLGIVNSYFDLKEFDGEDLTGLLATGTEMETGKYTQIRVVIDESAGGVQVTYEDEEGDVFENVTAKLPSGVLKFVRPFYVVGGTTTILTLDFDLAKSVNFTGASKGEEPKIIVKPVVKISVEQAEIDLTLTVDDITFTPASPVAGNLVTIDADIHNSGDIELNDVVVRFYNGDPADGGVQIDVDKTLDIPVGGSNNASVSWTPGVAGDYTIYVVVDPDNEIPESDEANNIAYKILPVQ